MKISRSEQPEKVVFTSKGQVVIPARIRRRHKIRKGTMAVVREEGTRIVLEPITAELIRSLRGSIKPHRGRDPLKILYEMRRQDRKL